MTTKTGRARAALRDALVGGLTPDERAHLYPQTGQYPTPCAWVGLPTITAQRSSTNLRIPVCVVVDGASDEQFAALDAEAARVWDAVRAVTVDGVRANPLTASPDTFGPEGATNRGLVIVVEIELATRTLCDESSRLVDPS